MSWQKHRARQAGKFAKASYQLQVGQQQQAHLAQAFAARQAHLKYWYEQGWQAAFAAAYTPARDQDEYACFMLGWEAAQQAKQALETAQAARVLEAPR